MLPPIGTVSADELMGALAIAYASVPPFEHAEVLRSVDIVVPESAAREELAEQRAAVSALMVCTTPKGSAEWRLARDRMRQAASSVRVAFCQAQNQQNSILRYELHGLWKAQQMRPLQAYLAELVAAACPPRVVPIPRHYAVRPDGTLATGSSEVLQVWFEAHAALK